MSVALSVAWGLFQEASFVLPLLAAPSTAGGFELTIPLLAVTWASIGVQYFVTPLAFYLLGRRALPGFGTGFGLAVVYLGAVLGIALGQESLVLLPGSVAPGFPFVLVSAAFPTAFLFLFTSFSGLALARLRKGGPHPGRTIFILPLVAMAFAAPENFWGGYLQFNFQSLDVVAIFPVFVLVEIISFPVEFLVFYYIGKRYDLGEKAGRGLGLLLLGGYMGAVAGSVIAVVLYGHSYWTANTGTTSLEYGIPLVNMPTALVALLEGLNPIASLSFLPFFAMTVSRIGRSADVPLVAGSQAALPVGPSA